MAETVQFYSSNITNSKEPKVADNFSMLVSVNDSLHNLCTSMEKLEHVLKMKNLELRINQKYRETRSGETQKRGEGHE